jgi:hypothetical protein
MRFLHQKRKRERLDITSSLTYAGVWVSFKRQAEEGAVPNLRIGACTEIGTQGMRKGCLIREVTVNSF